MTWSQQSTVQKLNGFRLDTAKYGFTRFWLKATKLFMLLFIFSFAREHNTKAKLSIGWIADRTASQQ